MKIINKTLQTMFINCWLLMLVYVFSDNINGWVVNIFFDKYYGFLDWLHDFFADRTFHHLLATILLSGACRFIQLLALKLTKSTPSFLLCLLLGLIALSGANECYWHYVQSECFGFGLVPLEDHYDILGTAENAQRYFQVCLCTTYAVCMLMKGCKYFSCNLISRTVMHQINLSSEQFTNLLCYYIPSCCIVAGYLYFPEIPYMLMLTVGLGAILLWMVAKITTDFVKINRYYKSALQADLKESAKLVIREWNSSEYSVIYSSFLRNREIMQTLETNTMFVLPAELADISQKQCIVLDIFDTDPLRNDTDKQHALTDILAGESGTFNIACCRNGRIPESMDKLYDYRCSDLEEAIGKALYFRGFLEYRAKQMAITASIQAGKLVQNDILVDELLSFRDYLKQNIDNFLVFDGAIKWLETMNYFYALAGISRQNIVASDEILKRISQKDFGGWIACRRSFTKNTQVETVLNLPQDGHPVFDVFESLWKDIIPGKIVFTEYTIDALFERVKQLRDYTRGHGVFTFEISQSINLKLIEVVVFLMNQLLEHDLLSQDVCNLEKLGWIVHIGEIPYFLFDYDPNNEECRFDSFRNGNSLMLSAEIVRTKQ